MRVFLKNIDELKEGFTIIGKRREINSADLCKAKKVKIKLFVVKDLKSPQIETTINDFILSANTTNTDDIRAESISKDIKAEPIADGKETSPVTGVNTHNDKENKALTSKIIAVNVKVSSWKEDVKGGKVMGDAENLGIDKTHPLASNG